MTLFPLSLGCKSMRTGPMGSFLPLNAVSLAHNVLPGIKQVFDK